MLQTTTSRYRRGIRACTLLPVLRSSILIFLAGAAQAQAPMVTSLSPTRNARAVPRTTNLVVGFSQILSNTVSTQGALNVFSQQAGGKKAGTATVSGNTLSFNPTTDFKAGETVFTTVTSAAQSTSGAAVTPQVFQFTTATTPSSGVFSGGFDQSLRSPQGMALGDVDNDGDLDILLQLQAQVSIRLNTGSSGTFVEGPTVPISSGTPRLVLGDLDSDGDLDFVAANTVACNNGDATFTTSQLTSFTNALFSVAPVLGDVDGDGDLDLIFTSINGSATIGLNDGNGAFPTVRSLPTVQNNYVSAVTLGDVDGDGDLDLLLSNQNQNNTVSVRLNNGAAIFSGSQEISGGGSSLALSDLDGDGDLDLVTSSSVYLNNGSGEFGTPQQVGVGGDVLGDLDGDGDLDLIKANINANANSNNTVTVRLNNGTGGFISSQDVALAIGSTQSLALGDLDDDGDLDLVTSKGYGDGLSVRLNQNQSQSPTIMDLSATTSAVGSSLVITGTNLVNVTQVTVNGVPVLAADVLSTSPTQLTIVVPVGATTGQVVVTTTAGVSNGLALSLLPYFTVKEVSPARNTLVAPRAAPVAVTFTQLLGTGFDPQQTISVFGQQAGGKKAGTTTVSGNTLTFDPSMDFKAGETVFATTKTSVQSSDGQPLAKPHVFQFTAAAAPAPALFNAGTEVSLGLLGPTTFVTGDVDGDGDVDLLLRGYSAATGTNITVRLNNGAGSFSGNQAVSVGAASVLVLGDIDADGDLDLLTTAALGGNLVYVRRNDSRGTFSGTEQVTVGNGASSIVLGDLDGDGDLDLITGNYIAGSVSIRFNNGTGVFTGSTNLSVTETESTVVTVLGDVDDDGDLDLVTNSRVLLNNGAGGFTLGQVSTGSNVLSSPAQLSDLDGDGDLDLLSNGVRLNDGHGIFGPIQQVGRQGSLGDVDGDGDLDLLTDNSLDNTVSVRLNNGNGSFALSQQVQMGPRPSGTTTADVDGDGDLDLLTATYNNNIGAVNVRLNQLPTSPPAVTSIVPVRNASSVPRTTPIAVTFDRPLSNTYTTQQALTVFSRQESNKQPGAATVSGNTLTFTPSPSLRAGETIMTTLTATAQSSGGASLAQPQVFQFTTATAPSTGTFGGGYELGTGNKPAAQVLVGDVDNDGDLDVVASTTSNEPNNIVSVRRNLGNNTFGDGADFKVGSFTQAMAWGDIDKNGFLDLLVASTSPNGSSLYVFRDSFYSAVPTQYPIGSGNASVVLGDVNADSNLDLITTSSSTGTVSVRLNDGTGAFGTAQEVRAVAPESALTAAVGDVDADGDLDIITNNGILFNNGSGRFNDQQQLLTGLATTYVAVGDVDKDNDLDYILVSENADATSSIVLTWLNNGTGMFVQGTSFALASRPPRIALGDVDGDGDLDLFAATASSMNVYRNNGTGNFSGTPPIAAGVTAGGLALADMDNNGTLDIITSISAPAGVVGVRLNNQLVLASTAAQTIAQLSVYPNPTAGSATLVCTSAAPQTATLTIRNAVGQQVSEQPVKLQAGTNQVPVSAETLSAGLYQLTLRFSNGQLLNQKLLVQPSTN